MLPNYKVTVGLLMVAFTAGVFVGQGVLANAASRNRVFEIRTYTTHDGRLPALVERMGNGERQAFERSGMKPVGFFVAAEAPSPIAIPNAPAQLPSPRSANTFVYILSHESREKAKESWARFREDPQWKEVRQRSEAGGPIVAKAETIFVNPTDYSALK